MKGRRGRSDATDPLDVELVIEEVFERIEPGNYVAVCVDVERCLVGTVAKVKLLWDVLVPNADAPDGFRKVRLPCFCNAKDLGQRTAAARGSMKLARLALMVMGRSGVSRRQKVRLRMFVGIEARVSVRTVEKDFFQRPLPEATKYSVVDNVLEVTAGTRRP